IKMPGMVEAAFVRSPHAHARILGIDTATALEMPGVVAIYTFADLRPHLNADRLPLQLRGSNLAPDCTMMPLSRDEVCFAGEAVALVVASSRYLAEDAAAAVFVDYDELPAVSDVCEG